MNSHLKKYLSVYSDDNHLFLGVDETDLIDLRKQLKNSSNDVVFDLRDLKLLEKKLISLSNNNYKVKLYQTYIAITILLKYSDFSNELIHTLNYYRCLVLYNKLGMIKKRLKQDNMLSKIGELDYILKLINDKKLLFKFNFIVEDIKDIALQEVVNKFFNLYINNSVLIFSADTSLLSYRDYDGNYIEYPIDNVSCDRKIEKSKVKHISLLR